MSGAIDPQITYGNGGYRIESVGAYAFERWESVFAIFKDQDNNPTIVTNAHVYIYQDEGPAIPVKTTQPIWNNAQGKYILLPAPPTPSGAPQYEFKFTTDGLQPGLYSLKFTSDLSATIKDIHVTGQFVVGYVTCLDSYIGFVRDALYDFNPKLYELMRAQRIWSDENIRKNVALGIMDVNGVPNPTSFTLDSWPFPNWVIDFAVARALRSREVLEIFNRMSYADVLSLNIDRPGALEALGKAKHDETLAAVKDWKAYWNLFGDDSGWPGMAFGETKIPLQISRVLSYLPNMSNTFGV